MIYVRRDTSLIPEKLLAVAAKAQARLEALPAEERIAFIKSKSHIWRSFKRYLRAMSYGKCWYSEAIGAQSFYDVDHFRPKSEARRSDAVTDEGYPWLAFDLDNFRFSAERSNRPNKDEDTQESVGKSSWFPLAEGSPVASWDNRCTADEVPLFIDPTSRTDVALLKVASDGRIVPSEICVGTGLKRVDATVTCLGLNLPDLWEERLKTMRDVNGRIDILLTCYETAIEHEVAADGIPVAAQADQIKSLTMPHSPFSLAARAKVIERGMAVLLAMPEDLQAQAA